MEETITSIVHLQIHRPNGEIKEYFVPWFGNATQSEAIQIYNWYRTVYKSKINYNGTLKIVSVQYVIPYQLNLAKFWQLIHEQTKETIANKKRLLYEDLLYQKILLKRKLNQN